MHNCTEHTKYSKDQVVRNGMNRTDIQLPFHTMLIPASLVIEWTFPADIRNFVSGNPLVGGFEYHSHRVAFQG